MRNQARVIGAAAVTAALAAVTAAIAAGAAGAAETSTTGTKPGVHIKIVSASAKRAADSELAARLGVSPARLDQALRAVKISLVKAGGQPTEGQFQADLARILGVPQVRVRQAFASLHLGGPKAIGPKAVGSKAAVWPGNDAFAAAVARELQVSRARVDAALRPLFAAGRADPSSPVFAAAARSLGVSTQQLSTALVHAKQSLAGAG